MTWILLKNTQKSPFLAKWPKKQWLRVFLKFWSCADLRAHARSCVHVRMLSKIVWFGQKNREFEWCARICMCAYLRAHYAVVRTLCSSAQHFAQLHATSRRISAPRCAQLRAHASICITCADLHNLRGLAQSAWNCIFCIICVELHKLRGAAQSA